MWKTVLLFGAIVAIAAGTQHEKVLLSGVQTLTLYRDQYTTGRRSSPIPQLKCVGGAASKSSYHPDVVQCYNRGFDGTDVQWECKADLDNAVKFGKINVYCEGFDYPDDPFILKGSCGLEYNLDYVSGAGQRQDQKTYHKTGTKDASHDNETGAGSYIIFIILCVFIYIIYANCIRSNHDDPRIGGQSRFRGGGGPPPPPFGGPPPPYDDRPSAPPGDAPPPYGWNSKQAGSSASAGGYQEHYQQARPTPMGAAAGAGAGAGPGGAGFWTGLGTGGVLGYLFGRRNAAGDRSHGASTWARPATTFASPPRQDFGGFFGSSTSNTANTSESSGSGTRSASGYGGTRRR